MTISNDTPLHGGIHAVSHNDGLPQQESFDGYMSTSPNGMARIQEGIQMTRMKFMTLRNNDKDVLNLTLCAFHPTTTKETSSKFSFLIFVLELSSSLTDFYQFILI